MLGCNNCTQLFFSLVWYFFRIFILISLLKSSKSSTTLYLLYYYVKNDYVFLLIHCDRIPYFIPLSSLDVNCDILLVTQLRPSSLRVLPLLHVHIPLMHPVVMTHEELVMFAQSASFRHSFTPASVIVHIRHQ